MRSDGHGGGVKPQWRSWMRGETVVDGGHGEWGRKGPKVVVKERVSVRSDNCRRGKIKAAVLEEERDCDRWR